MFIFFGSFQRFSHNACWLSNNNFIHISQSKRSSSWPSQSKWSESEDKVELVFGFHILRSSFAIIMQSSVIQSFFSCTHLHCF